MNDPAVTFVILCLGAWLVLYALELLFKLAKFVEDRLAERDL